MAALLDVSGVTLRYKTSSVVVTATEKVPFSSIHPTARVLGPRRGKSTCEAVGLQTPGEGIDTHPARAP